MNLQSMSRKLVVFCFAAVLLVGWVSMAGAFEFDYPPRIRLVGDEEPSGKPGFGMISIGDTIVIEAEVTPNDSLDFIEADMRKYGGQPVHILKAFLGTGR